MSHFAVLVIGENVEEQLAPFMENCCETPDSKYMTFTETEAEMLKEYETEAGERVVMPDGRLLYAHDEEFRVKGSFGIGGSTHEVPTHLERRKIPFKELFKTFEEFAREYHGCRERDEEKGKFGYWQNPNAKWDWFLVGGRWTGFFKMKTVGCLKDGNVGEPGLMTRPAKEGYADQALKCDIDFETMRRQAEEKAAVKWDAVNKAIAGTPPSLTWEQCKTEHGTGDIEKVREIYHTQPRVKAFMEFGKTEEGKEVAGFFSNTDEYCVPREQYLKAARDKSITTFAVLKDGKWFQRGEICWWGSVSEEKDQETWNSMFNNLLDSLPDTTLLTIVDCHI